MMNEILMEAATIEQLKRMAEINDEPTSRAERGRQVSMYNIARVVLETGCQAVGTQDGCNSCIQLNIEPLMCQRVNGTMVVRDE